MTAGAKQLVADFQALPVTRMAIVSRQTVVVDGKL